MAKPIVAIVGRPNVGKSTLFNRLIGERRAIVEDEPGTTRDRVYGTTDWGGVEFTIVDTGGLQDDQEVENGSLTQIARHTRDQAHVAIGEADVIVFMVDGRSGITAGDHEVADLLRRADKPTILVANKADSAARRDSIFEFYELGLGDPIAISSYHGSGTGDLLDRIVEALPEVEDEEEPEGPAIAIVGRPNVGKSRLLERLARPGAIDCKRRARNHPGQPRHGSGLGRPTDHAHRHGWHPAPGPDHRGIEQYSVLRSMRAIDRADVVLLVIDATEGFTAPGPSHRRVHRRAEERRRCRRQQMGSDRERRDDDGGRTGSGRGRLLDFMPYAPLVFVSAKFGQRVQQVLDSALAVVAERHKRVPTAALNKMLKDAVAAHPPPSKPGQVAEVLLRDPGRCVAADVHLFINDPSQIHFSYRRYLENKLRETFGFAGNRDPDEFPRTGRRPIACQALAAGDRTCRRLRFSSARFPGVISLAAGARHRSA